MNKIINTTNETASIQDAQNEQGAMAVSNVAESMAGNGGNGNSHSPHDPPGDHAPNMTIIIINGIEHSVKQGAVGYEEVVTLAGLDPTTKVYDVSFEKGPRGSESGTLLPGKSKTHIQDGELFTVVEHKKVTTIIVNGIPKKVEGDTISFEEVVKLAFEPRAGVCYTVVYEFGPRGEEHGSMDPGQVVHIKDGEVFDVSDTHQS